jgi:hypothetical protein
VRLTLLSEFAEICRKILAEGRSEEEWAQIESDDMFQTKNYIGGFDATEMEFCFSYFDASRQEFWFQCTLAQIEDIARGQISEVEARLASR